VRFWNPRPIQNAIAFISLQWCCKHLQCYTCHFNPDHIHSISNVITTTLLIIKKILINLLIFEGNRTPGMSSTNSISKRTNRAAKKKKGELINKVCQAFSNPDSTEDTWASIVSSSSESPLWTRANNITTNTEVNNNVVKMILRFLIR